MFDDFDNEHFDEQDDNGELTFTISVTKAPGGDTNDRPAATETPAEPAAVEATEAPTQPDTVEATTAPAQPDSVKVPRIQGQRVDIQDCGRDNALGPGAWLTMRAEQEDGSAASLAIRVVGMLKPDYFEEHYAALYTLHGTEAAVAIEVRNEGDTAVTVQDAVHIAFASKEDVYFDVYPLMDQPMNSFDSQVGPGETVTLYKRFAYVEEKVYPFLIVRYTTADGALHTAYFHLLSLR